jgi:hypothetical protein
VNSFLAAACPVASPSAIASKSAPQPSPTATICSKPQNLSNNWDGFYGDWVAPVVHFGIAPLVLFAIFIALSVLAAPLLVHKKTPGARSGRPRARWIVPAIYWYGVLCLACAAIEGTVVYPVERNVNAPEWVTVAAVVLCVFALALAGTLFLAIGREWPWRGWRCGHVWPVYSLTVLVGVISCAVGAGLGCLADAQYSSSRGLAWHDNAAIYALILMITGIGLAGRARGIGLGLLIKGHDKNGSDDAGLGGFVRARLYSLGTSRPRGILISQQTDVISLPSEALNLVPGDTWAKLAAAAVSWFGLATPWGIDVTEQSDSSVIVSIRRNGLMVAATAIRPGALSLPAQASEGAKEAGADADAKSSPATSDPSGTAAAAVPDWSAELRTAAAAFILVELSTRYRHLKSGLSGATQWLSIAQQVIATDPTSKLVDEDRESLLVRAIASDSGNRAAELALLSMTYRTAQSDDDHKEAADKLGKLLEKVVAEPSDGRREISPLELRLRFNLLAAAANYAVALPRDLNLDAALEYLTRAKEQAIFLLACKESRNLSKETKALWENMYPAIDYAALGIKREWDSRGGGSMIIDGLVEKITGSENISLLARYEHACALARSQSPAKGDEYDDALKELKEAVIDPRQRLWARTDPWLTAMHDVDSVTVDSDDVDQVAVAPYKTVARFKRLIGDLLPTDFLSLAPFAAHRNALADRGIHGAKQLKDAPGSVIKEVGITDGEVTRWRNLADLHQRLASIAPPSDQTADERATELVFLLLLLNLDSSAAVQAGPDNADLKTDLIKKSAPWAVVAPGTQELTKIRAAVATGLRRGRRPSP